MQLPFPRRMNTMKTYFGVTTVAICLIVTPFEAKSQLCDTATVLPNGHVLTRWCWPSIPTINFFGTSVQRRNEHDPYFWEIPQSTCTCPATEPCSIVDTAISTGVWYYRIREIDLDGTVIPSTHARGDYQPHECTRGNANGIQPWTKLSQSVQSNIGNSVHAFSASRIT